MHEVMMDMCVEVMSIDGRRGVSESNRCSLSSPTGPLLVDDDTPVDHVAHTQPAIYTLHSPVRVTTSRTTQ